MRIHSTQFFSFQYQIHDELFRLRKEYPDLVKLINLGKSYEKRNMLGIQVSSVWPWLYLYWAERLVESRK